MNRAPYDTVVPTIPLVEPWFPTAYADAVRDQVITGFLGPGRTTQSFSDALAAYIGVSHCVLTTSGTVALSVAATALGLRMGDEVLIPAYGVISTANGFGSIGLRPRLVDIDRRTACITPELLERAIGPQTRAACFVNFSGYTGSDLVSIKQTCGARGIPLIEDAACALGHVHDDRKAGSFGDVSILSFSVPKVLTTGQGGAVLTDGRDLHEKAAAFVDHGDLEWRRTNLNRAIGTNLRFNDVLASLGAAQLHDIEARLARRRAAHVALREVLGSALYSVPGSEAPLHNIVLTAESDRLVRELKLVGISAVRQYRTISQHPAYAELRGSYPNSDYWTDRAVYLPFGMALTPADGHRIGEAVLGARVPLDVLAG